MISPHLKINFFNFEIVGLIPAQDFLDKRQMTGRFKSYEIQRWAQFRMTGGKKCNTELWLKNLIVINHL
jgi:hypothetical protein